MNEITPTNQPVIEPDSEDDALNRIIEVPPVSPNGDGSRTANLGIRDIFDDLDQLRAPAAFESDVQVVREISKIPVVKRPKADRWFQISPTLKFEKAPLLVADRDDVYIVARPLVQAVQGFASFRMANLYLGVMRPDDSPFLWYVPISVDGSRTNDWWASAHDCARFSAGGQWVKLVTTSTGFVWDRPLNAKWEPKFPNLDIKRMLQLAFIGRVIETLAHPFLKELRGEE